MPNKPANTPDRIPPITAFLLSGLIFMLGKINKIPLKTIKKIDKINSKILHLNNYLK